MGIFPISGLEYGFFLDGYMVDRCRYDDYAKIEEWKQELEGYEWDSIQRQVYEEELDRDY
jgi:hypothetical protein